MAKRNLIIGLGGTGKEVVANIKKDLLFERGAVPPDVALLVFDVDDLPPSSAGGITLDEGTEIFYLGRGIRPSQVFQYLTDPKYVYITRWCEYDKLIFLRDMWRMGCARYRQAGRLIFFWDYQMIYAMVTAAIQNLTGAVLAREEERGDVEIDTVICGSLAGGTASGMLIDFAHMLRELLRAHAGTSSVDAVLLLADAFSREVPHGEMESLRKNTDAALMELNLFLARLPEYEIDDPRGGKAEIVKTQKRIFDACYLLDGINEHGFFFGREGGVRRIYPVAARIINLLTERYGSQTIRRAVNQPNVVMVRPRGAVFNSIGMASLTLNLHLGILSCVYRLGTLLLDQAATEPPSDMVRDEVAKFISDNGLSEKDIVGRYFRQYGKEELVLDYETSMQSNVQTLDRLMASNYIIDNTEEYRKRLEHYKLLIARISGEQKSPLIAQLAKRVDDSMNAPALADKAGGLAHALAFVRSLRTQLIQVIGRLQDNAAKKHGEYFVANANRDKLQRDLQDEAGRRFLFGGTPARDRFIAEIGRGLNAGLDEAKVKGAGELVSALLGVLENLEVQLAAFVTLLDDPNVSIKAEFQARADGLKRRREVSPSIVDLDVSPPGYADFLYGTYSGTTYEKAVRGMEWQTTNDGRVSLSLRPQHGTKGGKTWEITSTDRRGQILEKNSGIFEEYLVDAFAEIRDKERIEDRIEENRASDLLQTLRENSAVLCALDKAKVRDLIGQEPIDYMTVGIPQISTEGESQSTPSRFERELSASESAISTKDPGKVVYFRVRLGFPSAAILRPRPSSSKQKELDPRDPEAESGRWLFRDLFQMLSTIPKSSEK
jgi:hypothetical protein